MRFDRRLLAHFEWLLPLLAIAVSGLGVMTVYSATHGPGAGGSSLAWRQLTWLGGGCACMLAVLSFDYRRLERRAPLVYGILLVALLAVVAVMALRALRRREAPAPENVQFAGISGSERVSLPQRTASIGALHAPSTLPAGFDAAGFLRAAKLNFVKLQMANDQGKLDEIREFTTGEMFDALRKDVVERASAAQETDVVSLNADLLEVATEPDAHWASVRFSGMVREARGAEPVGFEEVWNLVKPADGSSGWLLAGIQQMH